MNKIFWIIGILLLLGLIEILTIRLYWEKKRNLRLKAHQEYLSKLKNQTQEKSNLKPQQNPNFLIIVTDDMGFADISSYGSKAIQTPYIDKLKSEGVSFSHFYSSSPICSPSRAGILTGRYPVRTHVPTVFTPKKSIGTLYNILGNKYSYGMQGISPDEITLGEILQQRGYSTQLIGKWHLGEHSPHLPTEKGFDHFLGAFFSNDMKPYEIYRDTERILKDPVDQTQLTQIFTKEACQFIEQNYQNPFFLYYCQPFPHEPVHASNNFRKTSNAGVYGDCIQELDWSVGQILNKLEEYDILNNTVILFTSDNGPWQQGNPGLNRGRKGLVFEGGQKVPFIFSYPTIFPQNMTIDTMAMNIDIFPSILELLQIPLPSDRIIDGKSFLSLLKGETKKSEHKYLFYFWNKHIQAIRDHRWKYHIRKRHDVSTFFTYKVGPSLYDFEYDLNESYNQKHDHAEKTKELEYAFRKMHKELEKNLRGWIDEPKKQLKQ